MASFVPPIKKFLEIIKRSAMKIVRAHLRCIAFIAGLYVAVMVVEHMIIGSEEFPIASG